MPRKRSIPGTTGSKDGTRDAQDITARHEPVVVQPAPVVEEPTERVSKMRIGKVAAAVSAFLLVAGVIGFGVVLTAVRDRVAVKIESVAESVDSTEGCQWQLEIELRNNSDERLTVVRVAAILNRGTRTGELQSTPRFPAGATRLLRVEFRLPDTGACPTPDEINHGNLIFHLDDGSSVSARF